MTHSKEYNRLHYWVRKMLGKASCCSNNQTHISRRYEWANISGEYKKDITDFKPLCSSCHIKMDNKGGKKGNTNHARRVKQYDRNGNLIKEWDMIKQASRELGILHTSIGNVLAGRSRTAGGWRWST